jgi:hypothetical protein
MAQKTIAFLGAIFFHKITGQTAAPKTACVIESILFFYLI